MVKEYKYINTEINLYDLDDKPLVIWGRSVSALKLYLQLKFEKVNVCYWIYRFFCDRS